MPAHKKPIKKPSKKLPARPFPWLSVMIPAAVVLLLAIGGFGFAASMEENNSFCASCHTQPESTFFQRSQTAGPVDLATMHNSKAVKCIDCHSGSGVTGRVEAMLLGARNAAALYTHTAQQPATLTVPIRDNNCLKCHQNTVSGQPDFNNHFHLFLSRWQAADPNAAGCVTCHASHSTDVEAGIDYLNRTNTEQVCQSCHQVLREGDGGG
jgi:predicted CXXCH cytochrome family protein